MKIQVSIENEKRSFLAMSGEYFDIYIKRKFAEMAAKEMIEKELIIIEETNTPLWSWV